MKSSDMQCAAKDNTGLCINTLGNFEIEYNGNCVFDENRRSRRIWELFNFLLTYRNKNLTHEKIIDNLLCLDEYDDPKNVLKAQIFRLRDLLSGIGGGGFFKLEYRGGFYTFLLDPSCVLDVDVFERLCGEYDSVPPGRDEEKLRKYRSILSVYKGEYLSSLGYEQWVTPVQNYYRRMFLDRTYGIIKILESHNMERDLADVCERASLVEPYDETLNVTLLRTYISLRKYSEAEDFYRYIASKYYREFGTKPSKNIQQIYKKIKVKENSEPLFDDERAYDESGPVYCAPDIFKNIYRIEKLRGKNTNTLCIITAQGTNLDFIPADFLEKSIGDAKQLLMRRLSKGDVFTVWNETQIYVMICGSIEEAKEEYGKRIDKKLNQICGGRSIKMRAQFEPV